MVIRSHISTIGLFFCLKCIFWSCCHLQDLKTLFCQYKHLHLANMQTLKRPQWNFIFYGSLLLIIIGQLVNFLRVC